MLKFKFPKKDPDYVKTEEILTFSYIILLLFTFYYGIIALDSRNNLIQQKENAKYKTGAPPDKIEGVILVIANNNSVPDLISNWRTWMHEIRTQMNRTEVYITMPKDLSWYPIGPIFKILNCSNSNNYEFCIFNSSMNSLIQTFPNFKWVLKIDVKSFINYNGLNKFLNSIDQTFYRKHFFKSAITQINKNIHIDKRSGWFMSRRTAFEWTTKMNEFLNLINLEKTSFVESISSFFKLLSIDIKNCVDQRFIPHSKTADEIADLIDYGSIDLCPSNFRYFDMINQNISLIKDIITWNLDLSPEERRIAMINLAKPSITFGYTITRTETKLCLIQKIKSKKIKI